MALIKCKECGTEVSTKAKACPKCGAVVKSGPGCLSITGMAFLVVVLSVIVFATIDNISDLSSTNSNSHQATDTKQATPTQEIFKQGETVHVGYTSYLISRSWWGSNLSSNPYFNERPDAAFLFVELAVRNDDKKARSVPPFSLVDENGAEYETTSKAALLDNVLSFLDSLNPGVQKQGIVVFDIPKGNNYKLKLSGGYWSGDDALVDLTPEE